MEEIVDYFSTHNINLTPAGRWRMSDDNHKEAIDAKRVDNLSWDSYPEDNMGRLFLTKDIVVVDVDGADVIIDSDSELVTIVDLGITIPFGLYTTTTQANKHHFYYKTSTDNLVNRLVKLHDLSIDIFTYGVVFEGHSFSEHNQIHKGDMIEAPQALLDSIFSWMDSKGLDSTPSTSKVVTLQSNIQRFNLVNMFLDNHLDSEKQWNGFFNSVMPLEYKPKSSRRLSISKYPLSYDIFNKVAVKLTTTKELDFHKQVVPTLYKLLTLWGMKPDSAKSQEFIWKNILPSLPQHESIFRYKLEDDILTLQQHLMLQPGTPTPIFRVISNKTMMFIQVDKASQEPILHTDGYMFDAKVAQALHPERDIITEDGKVVGWDSNVPIVYTINDPYRPQYQWDETNYRHLINLYTPTDYIKQVEILDREPKDNLIYKTVVSTIGKRYLDLYLAYSAQILFGAASPTMVLWVAALKTELGGSGKSVVTLELFSLMLGAAASAASNKVVASGWGDIVTSTKIISLEDMPELSGKEWASVYGNIKQQNTNSHRKLNMKGGAVKSARVSVAITGSTNYRLQLDPSDRRFFCIEPAHLHGESEPLNDSERLELAMLLQSHDYDERVQEYVNYLYHIFDRGFDIETKKALFITVPFTTYRSKWITSGASSTQVLVHALNDPEEFMGLCKLRPDDISTELPDLIELMLLTRSPTKRVAVSWKWLGAVLTYIQADKYADIQRSKSELQKLLNLDFKYVGAYSDVWRLDLPEHMDASWAKWPGDGYTFKLHDKAYEGYLELLKQLRDES